MKTIINKYYLEENSELMMYKRYNNHVDCYFTGNVHRSLSIEDFSLIDPENESRIKDNISEYEDIEMY